MGELAEEDWDDDADCAEYDQSIAKRLNETRERAARKAEEPERDRLVEAFAISVAGTPSLNGLRSEPILSAAQTLDLAEELADELLRRRRLRRGGA